VLYFLSASFTPWGCKAFDSVILVLFAAIRDRIGSRYPLDATYRCQLIYSCKGTRDRRQGSPSCPRPCLCI